MLRTLVLTLILAASCYGQSTPTGSVQTTGPNSPAQFGNNNKVIYMQGRATPTKEQKAESLRKLKERTSSLADDIFTWIYNREGPMDAWVVNQQIAQNVLDAINDNGDGNRLFRAKLAAWHQETQEMFAQQYWPRVITLETDLENTGVDLDPLTRAAALDGPRKIALMLSVIADRIGKQPPYARVLTSIEAKAIIKGSPPMNAEIYADFSDSNSKEIAEILRKEFEKQGWPVNAEVSPIDPTLPPLHGVHLIYPSADWTTVANSMIPSLGICELENSWEVQSMRQPPSILKVQIWPASATYSPKDGPPSLVVNTGKHMQKP